MKKRQKAGFLSPRSSKIIVSKEEEIKEKERAMPVALLVFMIATLDVFGRKKLLDA